MSLPRKKALILLEKLILKKLKEDKKQTLVQLKQMRENKNRQDKICENIACNDCIFHGQVQNSHGESCLRHILQITDSEEEKFLDIEKTLFKRMIFLLEKNK